MSQELTRRELGFELGFLLLALGLYGSILLTSKMVFSASIATLIAGVGIGGLLACVTLVLFNSESVTYRFQRPLLRFLMILAIILGVQALLNLFPVFVRIAGVAYFSLIFLGRLPLYVTMFKR